MYESDYIMKICVYAIAKDEIKNVDEWFESMSEADYIYVLDTGSTDGTFERLKELGVNTKQMIFEPFRFDHPRNESLKMAYYTDADVFICTDLDERLNKGWSDVLRSKWDDDIYERAMYRFYWKTKTHEDEIVNPIRYAKIHNRDYIWAYPVHETLVRKDTMKPGWDPNKLLNLMDEDLYLIHKADLTKTHRGTYLSLMELRYRENPDDNMSMLYLAREYMIRHMPSECIQMCSICLKNENLSKIDRAFILGRVKCRALWMMKQYNSAIMACAKAHNLVPTYRDALVNMGRSYAYMKHYKVALRYYLKALNETENRNDWMQDESYWTYALYFYIGEAHRYLGNKKEAKRYLEKALEFSPENVMVLKELKKLN